MRWPWHLLSPTSQSKPGGRDRRGKQVSRKSDKAGGWNSFWSLHHLVVGRWDLPASLGPPAHTTWHALDSRFQNGAGV